MCQDHGFFWMIYELVYHAVDGYFQYSRPAAPDPQEEQNGEPEQGENSRSSDSL